MIAAFVIPYIGGAPTQLVTRSYDLCRVHQLYRSPPMCPQRISGLVLKSTRRVITAIRVLNRGESAAWRVILESMAHAKFGGTSAGNCFRLRCTEEWRLRIKNMQGVRRDSYCRTTISDNVDIFPPDRVRCQFAASRSTQL